MEPASYAKINEKIKNNRFWVKIMRPDHPFKFSENKMLHSKPICWTNEPENLSDNIGIPVEKIREDQEKLLLQSLLNSFPAKPEFLENYHIELATTAKFLRHKEKIPIMKDEMIIGTTAFSARIDATTRTKSYIYNAPTGHLIYADPDKREDGIGYSVIKSRNTSTIEFEITALQGEYSVVFTSHEKWVHRVASGHYNYAQSEIQYMDLLKKEIEAKIKADASGTFSVFHFLKNKRI